METPRSNGRSRERSMSRRVIVRSREWVDIPDLESVGDFASSPHRRIFAIVSKPIPMGVEGKTARRVLIFDNHPDSLHLALKSITKSETDDAEVRRARRTAIICGSILVAMVAAAMLWPLWW